MGPLADLLVKLAAKHPERSTVPIDLVIFGMRVVEFVTVLMAGIIAVYLWAERIPASEIPNYGRAMLGGALVTETVFTWPGMGRLFLDSLGYSDYPVIMGLLMFSAILVIIGNLAADLITAFVDPRIRLA